MTTTNDNVPSAADDRIDALARIAGSELRRPAPEDGFAGVRRARRTQQIVRTGIVSGTAALVAVAGFFAIDRRDPGENQLSDVTTVEVVSTTVAVQPGSTATPEVTVTSTAPATPEPATTAATPDTTVASTSGAGAAPTSAAPRLYATPNAFGYFDTGTGVQSIVDSATGQVTGERAVDWEESSTAQKSWSDRFIGSLDAAVELFGFRPLYEEAGTVFYEESPELDMCNQNPVKVPAGSMMPAKAMSMAISPDRTRAVVLSAECPLAGVRSGLDPQIDQPYPKTWRLFDLTAPQQPGRTLIESNDAIVGEPHFSDDGRFVSFGPDENAYTVFDTTTGKQSDLSGVWADPKLTGLRCEAAYPNFARFDGPWIGASSFVEVRNCREGTVLAITDLSTGGHVSVIVPGTGTLRTSSTVEVDQASYTTPQKAWFTVCGEDGCWVGQGESLLNEVPGMTHASFLPLGFTAGG